MLESQEQASRETGSILGNDVASAGTGVAELALGHRLFSGCRTGSGEIIE